MLRRRLLDAQEDDQARAGGDARGEEVGSELGRGLDHQHAGEHGLAGEVAGDPEIVVADDLAGDALEAGGVLPHDVVDQAHRPAVGDELLEAPLPCTWPLRSIPVRSNSGSRDGSRPDECGLFLLE